MRDWGGAPGTQQQSLLLAETLGLAMARRAADILARHRHQPTPATPADPLFAADDAIFSAVLDAAVDCLDAFDSGTAEDRWCDALVHLLLLARLPPDAG